LRNDLTLTLDEEKTLDYVVRNADVVRIKVELSASEGADFITINPAEFYLLPSEVGEFTVQVSPFEELGEYSAQITGKSGRSTVTSDITISVVEMGLFQKKIIKELLGAPIHYGRPHTPDDEAWIESFNRYPRLYRRGTLKQFKLRLSCVFLILHFNIFPYYTFVDPNSGDEKSS